MDQGSSTVVCLLLPLLTLVETKENNNNKNQSLYPFPPTHEVLAPGCMFGAKTQNLYGEGEKPQKTLQNVRVKKKPLLANFLAQPKQCVGLIPR